MDEIIKVVSARLGVSESVAREAVKVLLEFACKRAAGTRLEKLLMELPGVTSLLGKTTIRKDEISAGCIESITQLSRFGR